MKRIKVSNTNYIITMPYRHLAGLDFVEYQENSATASARKLHEGEVDLALIPVAELAAHGGYVGLNYGLASRTGHGTIKLYHRVPLEGISRIYLYQGSSSSALLLRLLLKRFWSFSPMLVRTPDYVTGDMLARNEALLVLDESPVIPTCEGMRCTDLVREWYRVTGLPFVALVWAMRPGALTVKQHQILNRALQQSATARLSLARPVTVGDDVKLKESEKYVNTVRQAFAYYLNSRIIEGLQNFLDMSADCNLLPACRYRPAVYSLFKKEAGSSVAAMPVWQILQNVLDGKRLDISSAVRLARKASIADLSMVAEQLRSKVVIKPSFAVQVLHQEEHLRDKNILESRLQRMVESGIKSLRFDPQNSRLNKIEHYETLFHKIKERYGLFIEAFSVGQLILLARRNRISTQEAIARLVTAGLDAVSAEGGELLITTRMREAGHTSFSAEEWLRVVRWVHRYGAGSCCCLRISQNDSWEERFVHLHKLRLLQDELPGFRYFFTCGESYPENIELHLRITLTARIFLDNVPLLQVSDFDSQKINDVLQADTCASRLAVKINSKESNYRRALTAVRKNIWLYDIQDEKSRRSSVSELH
ncbi:MAG: hypothetical protein D6719_02720 [Candidatus Dadabacteria bacterium]|nr:MAG: hypothetical protein D6719_02720 [Candidatus Dadabacteria bacterium]